MAEVKVLSRVNLIIYPEPDRQETVRAVTYQTGFMPPRTVYIPEKVYSVDKEREAIKADIEKAETTKPETYEV